MNFKIFHIQLFLCLYMHEEGSQNSQSNEFIPEAVDEFIRKTVSHTLYIPLVNPPNKVWRDSTQIKTPTSPFQIGDSLRYTNEGHNEMAEIVYIKPMILIESSRALSY